MKNRSVKPFQNRVYTLVTLVSGLAITSSVQATTASVPEPNTIALIGAGVVGAILIARYKSGK